MSCEKLWKLSEEIWAFKFEIFKTVRKKDITKRFSNNLIINCFRWDSSSVVKIEDNHRLLWWLKVLPTPFIYYFQQSCKDRIIYRANIYCNLWSRNTSLFLLAQRCSCFTCKSRAKNLLMMSWLQSHKREDVNVCLY